MSSPHDVVDNDVHDVNEHVPPGRKRAPFFRYIRINLPRLTKAVILLIIAWITFTSFVIARTDFEIFAGSDIALYLVSALAAIFCVVGLLTKARIWDFGMLPALAAIVAYIGGLFGTAPYVWNGAGIYTAAAWNTMFFAGIAYVIIRWALGYGVLVAYPDDQGFGD